MLSSGFRLRQQILRPITLIVLFLAMGASVWAQTTPAPRKHKAKPADKPQPQKVATPAPPPLTPEQMPARPPTVSYQDGQLSIVAPNSTLSDILQAVKSKTGASIDIPPGANERVVSRFGPGPARDVLAALLNGSHFNYVMIGSDANPTSVAQVILTPRTGGETPPVTQAGVQPNPAMQQYPGQVIQPQPYGGGQAVYQQVPVPPQPDEAPAADSEEDDNAAQQQDNGNGADEGAPDQANQGTDGQENPQPQVKTPEQLLQELQRQQQIQQQRQQQQGQQPQMPVSPPQ